MRRCFKSKRWIAFFLALLLIVTTCINSSDVFLWATEDNEAVKTEQPVSSPAEEVVVMEVKEETDSSKVTDEAGVEGAETGGTDNDAQENPTEEPEQGTDQSELQEPAEEEVPEEVLEEEVQEKVPEEEVQEKVPEEEVSEDISETVGGVVTYNYAVYYYYDGVEDEDARAEGTGALGDPIFTSAADETVHDGKNYVLDRVENKDGKIGEDAGQNVVKVYYVLKEEVVEKPAQTLTVTADDGAKIIVEAPEGALPKNAKVTAKVVTITSEMQEAVNDAAGEKAVKILKAYDVIITDAEGNEIQPDDSVKVTIQNANVKGENLSVYHISEEGTEKVAENTDGNRTSFEVEHFSVMLYVSENDITAFESGAVVISVNEEKTLEADNARRYSWSSTDTEVASVNNGTVTGKKAGATTITARDGNRTVYTYQVEVKEYVYVYMQLKNMENNQAAIEKLGLTVNGSGWVTLGRIDVSGLDIPAAEYDGNETVRHMESVKGMLGEIERYREEPYIFDLNRIEWQDLTASDGADRYVSKDISGKQWYTWHMNGILDLEHMQYTVNYLDEEGNAIHAPLVVPDVPFASEIKAAEKVIDIEGYLYDYADKEILSVEISNAANVINLYYKKDFNAVKELSYTVEYYKDDVKTDDSYVERNSSIWIHSDVLPVENEIIYHNKYEGYTLNRSKSKIVIDGTEWPFSDTMIPAMGENIKDGTVIKLYYDRNSQKYTVRYLEEATGKELAPERTVAENVKFGDRITADTEGVKQTITGYDYVETNPAELLVGTDNTNNVLTVYYRVKEIGYTVNYHYSTDGKSFVLGKTVSDTAAYDSDIPYDMEANKYYDGKGYIPTNEQRDGRNHIVYGPSEGKVSEVPEQNVVDIYYVLDANDNGVPDYLEHSVIYNGNGGKGTVTDGNTYAAGEPVTVEANEFSKDDVKFAYWLANDTSIGANGVLHEEGTFVMPDKDIVLTAQWRGFDVRKEVVSELPEGQDAYQAGDTIEFEIRVTNIGDVALTDIVVEDTLKGAVIDDGSGYELVDGKAVIDLLPAKTEGSSDHIVTVSAHYDVDEDDLGKENFRNTATVKAGEDVKNKETADIPMEDVDEQLTVTKRIVRENMDDPDSAPVGASGEKDGKPAFTTGDTVSFEIIVTNTGNKTLEDISVEEALENAMIDEKSAFVNFFTGLFRGVRQIDGEGTISRLSPGDSETITATYEIKEEDLGKVNLINVATATVNTEEGLKEFRGESEPIPVEDPESGFNLSKTVTGSPKGAEGKYKAGDEVTYFITVGNTGNTALNSFEVKDDMRLEESKEASISITDRIVNPKVVVKDKAGKEISGATLNWQNGVFEVSEIPAGGSAEISYTYTVKEADAGKTINNVATAGEGDNEQKEEPADPPVVEKRSLSVVKEVSDINDIAVDEDSLKTNTYKAGDVIHYTVTIKNTGNVELRNIDVIDTMNGNREASLNGGESSSIASLAAGTSITLHYSYTVDESDHGEKLINSVSVKSGEEELGRDEAPEIEVEKAEPKAELSKRITSEGTAEGGKYAIGEKIAYMIEVKNAGNTSLKNVIVKDTMTNASGPITNIKLNGEESDGIWDSGNGQFTIPNIAIGSSAVITYEYEVRAEDAKGEKIDNRAEVDNVETEIKENPDSADVERRSLTVTKRVNSSPAEEASYQLWEKVVFVVTVENNGNVSLSDIRVSDEMQNAAGEAKYDAVLTGENNANAEIASDANGDVILRKLDVNEKIDLYYTYEIQPDDIGNTNSVWNKVRVNVTDVPEQTGSTDPLPIAGKKPSYEIAKRIISTGSAEDGKYATGDTISYEITVKNTGNTVLSGIEVADNMENTAGSISGYKEALRRIDAEGNVITDEAKTASWNGNTKTFSLGNIPIGDTAVITYDYVVQPEDKGKKITNTAQAGEQETDPVIAEEVEERSLTLVKEVLDENGNVMTEEQLAQREYKVGEIVDFTVTVTNTGNVTLEDVAVGDRMWATKTPGVTEGGSRTAELIEGEELFDLVPEEAKVLRYQYEVTEEDLGYGLYNQATAQGEPAFVGDKVSDTDIAGPINVEAAEPKVSVVKTITSSPDAETGMYKVGDTISYQIAVTNKGNVTLKDVEVKDTMNGASDRILATSVKGAGYNGSVLTEQGREYSFTVAEIPRGETRNITYSYRIQKDDIGKTISNAAVVEDIENEEEPENPVPIVIENRKLEVSKTIINAPEDGASYKLGETIRFNITVKNAGNVELRGIKLTDIMDGASGNAVVGTGSNTLMVGDLTAGEDRSYTFTYVVKEEDLKLPGRADAIKNTATAVASDGTTGYDETEFLKIGEQNPDFTIAKNVTSKGAAEDGKYVVGEAISYEIIVTNTGNTTLRNIVVKDFMTGIAGEISNVAGAAWNERMGSFIVNDPIAVGGSAKITYDYVVQPEDAGKTIRNTAIGKPGSDVVREAVVENKELSVMKYAANKPANGTAYVMGEEVLFGVTVRNIGNVSLSDIRITDQMQNASGEAVAVNVNEEGEITPAQSEHTIEHLAPGEYTTVYYNYIIQEEDVGKTGIRNMATAESEDGTVDEDETRDIPIDGRHTLMVHYVYAANGMAAAASYSAQLPAGKDYMVYSPVIQGYNSSAAFVAGTMPEEDIEFIIYYSAPAPAPTPGGGGGGGDDTPDTPPVPQVQPEGPEPVVTIPPIPVPAGAIPVAVPTGQALAAIDDEEVPLQGALIDVDEDGNVTITPISEEEVPLAGGENDEHKCCILHFLLMLAALIIYTWFTCNMKKRQRKLAELEDRLAEETLKRQSNR